MTVNLHFPLVERAEGVDSLQFPTTLGILAGVDSLQFPTTLGILAGVSPATAPALALLLLVDMAKVSDNQEARKSQKYNKHTIQNRFHLEKPFTETHRLITPTRSAAPVREDVGLTKTRTGPDPRTGLNSRKTRGPPTRMPGLRVVRCSAI